MKFIIVFLTFILVYSGIYSQDSTKVPIDNLPKLFSIGGIWGNSFDVKSKGLESEFPRTHVNHMKGFKISGTLPLFMREKIKFMVRADYFRFNHSIDNEKLEYNDKELRSGYFFVSPQVMYMTKLGDQPFNISLSFSNYGNSSDKFFKLSYLVMAVKSFDWNGHKFRAGIGYIYIQNQLNTPIPLIISNKAYGNNLSLNMMFPLNINLRKELNFKNHVILGLKLDPFNSLLVPEKVEYANTTFEFNSLGFAPEIKYEYNFAKSFWVATNVSYRMNLRSQILDDNHNVLEEVNQGDSWTFSVQFFIRPTILKRK